MASKNEILEGTRKLIVMFPCSIATISGKKVEVAVKKIVSGEAVNQRGALANPSSLNLYYNIPELQLLATGQSAQLINGHST